jgi:retinol dehydrogenase 12
MQNKVVVVTGATNGIGLETAKALAGMGARLIGVGRNADKCATVSDQLRRESGNKQIEYLVADLSLPAQVRRVAENIKQQTDQLDVLVNNAGMYFARREESADGIEMTWALNHLNYFLLTELLLDRWQAAPAARIVNVSSMAHAGAKGINFEDVEFTQGYSGWMAYSHSKLANIMFTYELARRLQGSTLTANVLHPGFVDTGFGHNNGGIMSVGMTLAQKIAAKKPAQGAATSIYLATSPDVAGVSGKYFDNKKAKKSSDVSYDIGAQQRLWELSEQTVRQRVAA